MKTNTHSSIIHCCLQSTNRLCLLTPNIFPVFPCIYLRTYNTPRTSTPWEEFERDHYPIILHYSAKIRRKTHIDRNVTYLQGIIIKQRGRNLVTSGTQLNQLIEVPA